MSVKILVADIETAPILAYVWGIHDQHLSEGNIKEDWYILSWAAKWLGDTKMTYRDSRNAKNIQNDKPLVQDLSALLNEADIVISQNGDKFDFRRINARAAIHKLPPIRPYKSTDILKESRKVFGFTSHKLSYMTDKINKKYKKLLHSEYPGLELWKAVLRGDKKAWAVMEVYCKHDVLSTEELYTHLQGWMKIQHVGAFLDEKPRCRCGSAAVQSRGYMRTEKGKYQRYHCQDCGKWLSSSTNLLSKETRKQRLK